MDTSSTFWSLLSVMAILAIMSVAITNVEDQKLRNTFATTEASEEFENEEIELIDEAEAEVAAQRQDRVWEEMEDESSDWAGDEVELPEVELGDLSFEISESLRRISETEEEADKDMVIFRGDFVPRDEVDQLENFEVSEIFTTERLIEAGIERPLIQRRPFEGVLFEDIDMSSLAAVEVKYEVVQAGVENEVVDVLEVYSFESEAGNIAEEIYDFIMLKAEAGLGVEVNETNRFGLKSFYVNYLPQREKVFLVVKYVDSVYALSYLKEAAVDGAQVYEIVRNLL